MKRLLSSKDRRASTRVVAGVPVMVRIKNFPSNISASLYAETADLSSRGASLLLKNSLPVSLKISMTLDLTLPFHRLETDGEVVWNYFLPREKKFNCGVRFLGLKRHSRNMLEEFTKTKSDLGEIALERRKWERRAKLERRTVVVSDYAPERRRVCERRSFDRRAGFLTRFFQRLTRPILQLVSVSKKKGLES